MKSQWCGKSVLFYAMQAAQPEMQHSPLSLFRQCNRPEKLEGVRESTGANQYLRVHKVSFHQSVTLESHPLSSLALGQREGIIQTASSFTQNNAYSKYYSYIHALTYRRRASMHSVAEAWIFPNA